jgi:ABC-2 type transport system permease protein
LLIGAAASGLLVLLSTVVYGGAPPADWAAVAAAFLLVAVAFASLGVLLGVLLPTARSAQGVGVLLFFVFMNLGGAGPPPELLPDPMETVGNLVPVTPASELLRGPWLGLDWEPAAAIAMAGLVGVSLLVGVWRLRKE